MSRNLSVIALAAFAFSLTACEDPGNIGGQFLDSDASLETKTILVGAVEEYSTDSFTGRHRFMPIGRYDDALFGEFTAVGVIRPSIDTTRIGTAVSDDDILQLQLVFSSAMYGDTTSTSEFDIYRLAEPWRGSELRFGDDLAFDDSEKVGEFSVTGNETVTVDLDASWVQEYNVYLGSEGENRNAVYRDEFPGLAIVPAGDNSTVLFADMRAPGNEEEDDLNHARFVVSDQNGEGEDDNRLFQRLADWGSLSSRSGPGNLEETALTLHNSLDSIVRIDPDINEERLGSRNLANVTMVFYENRDLLEDTLPDGHVRPGVNQLRMHIIESGHAGDYIFSRNPHFVADLDSSDNSFRFDMTDYANSVLFSSPRPGGFYLSAQGINGIVFTTSLFSQDAPEGFRPKILITSVKSEN